MRAPDARWKNIDISDHMAVQAFFDRISTRYPHVNFVLHMAAFYHFGQRWLPEDEKVNIRGLQNILEGAFRVRTRRFIFAGSIASLRPPPVGAVLTEESAPITATAYTRSKTIGEALLAKFSLKYPVVALRIGGVFSDWCELPPLYSLMKLWSNPTIFGRMIPGRGMTGFPCIHRRDLVKAIRRIIERNDALSPYETLFASPPGCTTHIELFDGVHRACGARPPLKPIHVSPTIARSILTIKNGLKILLGRKRYERRWMMDYVDTPLVVDTRETQKKLQWTPGPELSILNRLPILMDRFLSNRTTWELRNIRRNEGRYQYGSNGRP